MGPRSKETAELATPPSSTRRLLTFQTLFLVVAVGLFAITWITDSSHSSFVGIFLYTFVTGNLTSLGMARIYPHFAGFRNSYRWLAYVGTWFVLALARSTVGVLAFMVAFRMPVSSFRDKSWGKGVKQGCPGARGNVMHVTASGRVREEICVGAG